MVGKQVDYSVVIPVYNNSESLDELLYSIEATLSKMNTRNEIIFVVDGSPDNSYEKLIKSTPWRNTEIIALNLSRNFGSIAAVRTGMARARGAYVSVLAADLQEPTEILSEFYDELEYGLNDVVIGERISRNDPVVSKIFSRIYWFFYRKTINSEIPTGGVDVFACTKKANSHIVKMLENESSLVGLLFWVGFNRKLIPYTRFKRPFGKSAWTFRKKLRYLTDSVFAFSDAPILLLQVVGMIGIFLSLSIGVLTILGAITGHISQPGYPSLIAALALSSSSILLGLGIVGEYARRAFENTKMRPLSIVKEEVCIPPSQVDDAT
jgi:glycosyltransferase involved in cell wall biosynthesis